MLGDPTKDVFLYLHTPWCIHCKAVEAVIVDLALHYSHLNDTSIVLYRMDGAKNEIAHPEVKVSKCRNKEEFFILSEQLPP